MFKITPAKNPELIRAYAEKCGISVKDGAFIYSMVDYDTEELMALSQFEIFDGYGYIYDLAPVLSLDDFEAMFILGRQTMNFIDLCGVHLCRASAGIDKKLLSAIGFKPENEDTYICNMEGFFDGSSCSSHH